MQQSLTRSAFVRWRAAVFAVFAACGLGFATWAGRVPAIKEALDISKSEIGLALISNGVASIIGLSLASLVIARFGTRRGMLGLLIIAATGLGIVGIGADVLHSYPVLVIGLFLFGLGNGCCDVLMNVEGAAVETYARKTILPMCHGFFSLGTFIGAGSAALAEGAGLSVAAHALLAAALIVVLAVVSIANVPVHSTDDISGGDQEALPFRERLRAALSAWTEPRTYGIGLVLLGMSFAEGGANDWLALGMVEGHDASEQVGAIGLAVFAGSMTVVRMLGGPIVDRIGRVAALRILAGCATVGLLLFIFAPTLPLVFVGAVLWGVGASLGFPLGVSAAADDPARAAARVSATATIGYVAFLAGPPVLGFIADNLGLLNTLLIVAGLAVISGLASHAARPLRREDEPSR